MAGKVVHLAKYYFPDVGGIEHVTKQLVESDFLKSWTNVVIAFADKGQRFRGEKNEIVIKCKSVNILSQPLSISYVINLLKECRNANIIHFHFPNILPLFFLAIFFGGKRFIVHWHSDIVSQKKIEKILSPIILIVLSRAQYIIATSSSYAQSSIYLARFKQKVKIIPLGISKPARIHCDIPFLEARFPSIANKNVVFSIGRSIPYKGYIEFLQSLDRDKVPPNTLFVIAGDGPLRHAMLNIVAERGLEEYVHIIGRVSDEEKRYLMERSNSFFLPSLTRAEAFGIVLIEALSYGLPIITFNIPGSGVNDVNSSSLTGVRVPLGNFDFFIESCCNLSSRHSSDTSISERCRERFESEFTEDLMLSRISDLYAS